MVVALLAIVGAALVLVPGSRLMPPGAYIARIKVQGLIRGNQDRVEALGAARRSRARAVIVHIDSPGGTTAGSEQLYDALRDLQGKKPMVVVVDGLAASGAYIAALSAEHIMAQETSLVGSIGVLFQYPNFTDVLKTIGIKVEEMKSSPLKAAPNGFEPTSPEARAAIEAIVLRLLCLVQRAGEGSPQNGRRPAAEVSPTAGSLPAGRASASSSLTTSATKRRRWHGWRRKRRSPANTPVRDYSLRAAFQRAFFPACSGLDLSKP